MKNKLLIIGASGHGKVCAEIALKMNKWETIYFLDDDTSLDSPLGIEIIGKTEEVYEHLNEYEIFIGIGNNSIREMFQEKLEARGAIIPVLIHPSAVIGIEVEIQAGTVVMAGVIINSSTRIGKGCIINTSTTIDHNNLIGDYVHFSPGVHLAGAVKVGRGSWLGIGSVVSNNVCITYSVQLGAGAIVIKNLIEPGLYVGVPARRIKDGENFNISKL